MDEMIERSLRLKSLLQHLLQCHCPSLRICVQRLSLSPSLRRIARRTKINSDGRASPR
jgi:hypothetical protein